jgi:phage gpG-like protein
MSYKVKRLEKILREEIPKVLFSVGGDVATRIVKTIDSQPSDWEPLSEAYVRRKGERPILVDTGALKQSIREDEVKHGEKKYSIDIGIFRDNPIVNPKTGVHPLVYAWSHEFGTWKITIDGMMQHIPERSYMRKTFDEQEAEILDDLSDRVGKLLDDAFRS